VAYTPGTPAGPFALGMFSDGREEFAGLVAGGHVHQVAASIADLLHDWNRSMRRLSVLAAYAPSTANPEWRPVSELRVLTPVRPRQILQSGANYRQHVVDLVVSEGDSSREAAEAMMDARAANGEPYLFVRHHRPGRRRGAARRGPRARLGAGNRGRDQPRRAPGAD
jgi:hypothetical protein